MQQKFLDHPSVSAKFTIYAQNHRLTLPKLGLLWPSLPAPGMACEWNLWRQHSTKAGVDGIE